MASSLCTPLISSGARGNEKAPDLPSGTRLEKLLDGLDVIWGLAPLSENEAILTLKSGKLFHVNFKTKAKTEISGLPKLSTSGQGGLLDIKTSPSFQKDGLIFFTYSKKTETGDTTALASARLNLSERKLELLRDLFVAKTDNSGGVHFGSRITFDDAGHLYFGVGDRGERDRAQSLSWHNGKIIRLNLDGSIPKDNPFVGMKESLPEIYSYGHRNPQGLIFVRQLGKLFNSEHGPRGGDEINEVKKGANYGWPIVTFGREYYGPRIGEGTTKAGIESPLKVYIPSIAPSSLVYYGSGPITEFSNSFVLGALVLEHINVVSLDGKQEKRFLKSLSRRIRQVALSPAGHLLFTTDSGEVFRISDR